MSCCPDEIKARTVGAIYLEFATVIWPEASLSERFSRVHVGGEFSGTIPTRSGVPQGSVIGSLLFQNLPIKPFKGFKRAIEREVTLPDAFGIPFPVPVYINGLGLQTDSSFSSSVQCTNAADRGLRLIFLIRRSIQDLSKSAFIP